MNRNYNFAGAGGERIVYIRPVEASELPEDVRAEVGETAVLYALHSPDGERLALVRDRRTAFILARQNDFAPVSVN